MPDVEPCARCGLAAAVDGVLCGPCGEAGPLSPAEARRARVRKTADAPVRRLEAHDDDGSFEGVGDFYSEDPWERYIAHRAAKGR